jgi:hypothetical protein
VRYPKRKMVLFFVVQALAVALMIQVLSVNRRDGSAAPVIVVVLLLVGELAFLVDVMRSNLPAWRALFGLGAASLVGAGLVALWLPSRSAYPTAGLLAVWHVVLGLLLITAGLLAGIADLLARWRRPDNFVPEDERSTGMWPFD